jgi:FkbM family methyltransferase
MISLKRFFFYWIRRVVGTEQILNDMISIKDLQNEVQLLRTEAEANMNAVAVQAILTSSAESWFDCIFNGAGMWLPRHTLRIMIKALRARPGRPFEIEAEISHMNWLAARTKPGTIFLDVGAATGTVSLPIALRVPGVKIIAFEPSRTANRVFRETLARNAVTSVEVNAHAVSDACGSASFSEIGFDPTGYCFFLPETSSLTHDRIGAQQREQALDHYEVPVTALDAFFAERADAHLVQTIKIDVEGFETKVVHGAMKLLKTARPHIAIDIHPDPFGEGTTEPGVRGILEPLGYRFEKMGHVLLCYPPRNLQQ